MNRILVRKRFGTDQWEVIERYGYREVLLAVRNSKAEALSYADIRRAMGN